MTPTKYRRKDTGEIAEVGQSFDGKTWIAFSRSKAGGMKRIKSPSLPPVQDRGACQWNLDRYAEARGWSPVSVSESVDSPA